MKLVSKHIEKDNGTLKLIAEDSEDLWHVYNLLQKNDLLRASTIRRVTTETATGSTDKSSQHVTLQIQVESVFYDVQVTTLRVNGRNQQENKFVKMGAYHTLDLELHRPFSITKPEWDSISLERVDSACNIANKAEIAAIVLQEGLAQICLVTDYLTVVKQRIETNIPKKRRGTTTDYDKGIKKFLDQCYTAICQHIDFKLVKVLIIASPGFIKNNLHKYIIEEALRTGNRSILDNRDKLVLVHSSSGHKHALTEVLQDESVQSRLSDTKFSKEVKSLESFYKSLSVDESKAFYGIEYVEKAAEFGAIETLLISDSLFRSDDIPTRKKYIKLVESVREAGAEVLIFSSLHTSGEQLLQLTGVAAILHFGMPELEIQVQEELEQARLNGLLKSN